MSGYKQIHTRMWRDAWFMDLLPDEKLLFVYLFSNTAAALCGLYELSVKTMSFETGLRMDAITLALHRFGQAGKAFYEAPHVWVPNLMKYNANASPKVRIKIDAELAEIPECPLKRRFLAGDMTPPDMGADGMVVGASVQPYTVSGDIRPFAPLTVTEQEHEQQQSAKTSRRRKAPDVPRPHDPLFDAIAETCQVDPATAGPSIGKVRAALLKATPPYTVDELQAFKAWWWAGGKRQRPPRVWDLQEQIGVVRTETPRPEPKGFAAVRQAAAELKHGD